MSENYILIMTPTLYSEAEILHKLWLETQFLPAGRRIFLTHNKCSAEANKQTIDSRVISLIRRGGQYKTQH